MASRTELQTKFLEIAAKDHIIMRFSRQQDTMRTMINRHDFKSNAILQGNVLHLFGNSLHGSVTSPMIIQLHLRYWCEYAENLGISFLIFDASSECYASQVLSSLSWSFQQNEDQIILYQKEDELRQFVNAQWRIQSWVISFMELEPLAHVSLRSLGRIHLSWHGSKIDFQYILSPAEFSISHATDPAWESIITPIDEIENALTSAFSIAKKKFRLHNLMNPTFVHFSTFMTSFSRNTALIDAFLQHLQIHGVSDEEIERISLSEMKKGTPPNLYENIHFPYPSIAFRFGSYYVHISAFDESSGMFDIHHDADKHNWISRSSTILGGYMQKSMTLLFQRED